MYTLEDFERTVGTFQALKAPFLTTKTVFHY